MGAESSVSAMAAVRKPNRRAHSPLPSASAIDFPYTIRRNLKNYNAELKTVIPERVWFFDRSSRVNRWHVILDIDQSGSMGQSILYSSVMACVLASMSAVKTSVVAFDTQIMDLTPLCADPVDLLFGFQMGGGTDIAKSIAYCQGLVEAIQKKLLEKTGKHVEVMVYGDGAFKDPVGKIWELADPVVSPAYTAGLEGTPNELKLKYLADNDFAHLSGDALKEAIKDRIHKKDGDLVGQMVSEGTTPRRLTDLIGSLCDLTSGSGDKGTPVVFIQGYFDNYTK